MKLHIVYDVFATAQNFVVGDSAPLDSPDGVLVDTLENFSIRGTARRRPLESA